MLKLSSGGGGGGEYFGERLYNTCQTYSLSSLSPSASPNALATDENVSSHSGSSPPSASPVSSPPSPGPKSSSYLSQSDMLHALGQVVAANNSIAYSPFYSPLSASSPFASSTISPTFSYASAIKNMQLPLNVGACQSSLPTNSYAQDMSKPKQQKASAFDAIFALHGTSGKVSKKSPAALKARPHMFTNFKSCSNSHTVVQSQTDFSTDGMQFEPNQQKLALDIFNSCSPRLNANKPAVPIANIHFLPNFTENNLNAASNSSLMLVNSLIDQSSSVMVSFYFSFTYFVFCFTRFDF